MYFSRHNLILPMKENDKFPYAILNSLSGAFDLVTQTDYQKLITIKKGGPFEDQEFVSYLLNRGYIYQSESKEQEKLTERWPEFKRIIKETPSQVLLILTYGCNLACTYCYQNGIKHKKELITKEVVDAFFKHLSKQFADKKPFITLFGGEALIGSKRQKEITDYIVKQAALQGYAISVVTNGYDLLDYLDILQQAEIKEVQITLDGPKQVHDQRRYTKNGKGTYDRIMKGLHEAINRGIPINLRMVVDKSNFEDLIPLAEELNQRGWLDLPVQRFKTQIGRNYELFECYEAPQQLLNQAEHWAMFVALAEKYPILKKLHKPEFKGIHHLVQTGELYIPSFDTCPACKTEWVFDLYGDIYGCTATTGQDEYKLGTFYPEYDIKKEDVREWEERSILTIPECQTCDVSLICGGGCGAVAKHKTGRTQSPDCRPIKEILKLGLEYYGEDLLSMGHEQGSTA